MRGVQKLMNPFYIISYGEKIVSVSEFFWFTNRLREQLKLEDGGSTIYYINTYIYTYIRNTSCK